MSDQKPIVIIGAGPAGLTAAYELAVRTNKEIIVIESEDQVGGISKTIDFQGNKIDIGGHRFFSKSEWVLDWWQQFLPIKTEDKTLYTTYRNQSKSFPVNKTSHGAEDGHMLVRPRKSRIIYKGNLFDYPLKLNFQTFWGIGLWKSLAIFISLLKSRLRPVKQERNLEDFYINRFGKVLYRLFFREYTYKVWGKSCKEISAEWGRQRVQGISLRSILRHYFTTLFFPRRQLLGNQQVEQSLTEFFLYPERGPGQLWESVARKCKQLGVEIRFRQSVAQLHTRDGGISELLVNDLNKKTTYKVSCDFVLSTMPVQQLVGGLIPSPPSRVFDIAMGLEYRDFIIIGLQYEQLAMNENDTDILDNWLYVQDSSIKMGRVQLFHNWSPFMVAQKGMKWVGAEYFCYEGDSLWEQSDKDLIALASNELTKIGLTAQVTPQIGKVIRIPKAYPSYVGSYVNFGEVRSYLDKYDNLFLIGRNGTHRYNNQDHSMLSAKEAVDNILNLSSSKDNVWNVNVEEEYHEKINS